MERVIRNVIRCKKCGDVIESTYTHDFKFCSCGAVAVDGGHDYLRRCGNREDWEDLSETVPMELPVTIHSPFTFHSESSWIRKKTMRIHSIAATRHFPHLGEVTDFSRYIQENAFASKLARIFSVYIDCESMSVS